MCNSVRDLDSKLHQTDKAICAPIQGCIGWILGGGERGCDTPRLGRFVSKAEKCMRNSFKMFGKLTNVGRSSDRNRFMKTRNNTSTT